MARTYGHGTHGTHTHGGCLGCAYCNPRILHDAKAAFKESEIQDFFKEEATNEETKKLLALVKAGFILV